MKKDKKNRKFPFSSQLLLIFILVLSIAGLVFSFLILSKVTEFSRESTISRLTSVVDTSKNDWNSNNTEFTLSEGSDFPVAYVRYTKETKTASAWMPTTYSDDIKDVVPQNAVEEIISKVEPVASTNGTGTITYRGREYYYAYEFTNPLDSNGIIIITDSHYANTMRHDMAVEFMYIFAAVFLMSAVIIFVWSRYYTTRLHRLKTHVSKLPKNNYEDEYLDQGHDELAELSEAIESMRMDLYTAEDQKREMLHNLSHDFKTPIAVIKSYTEAIKDGVEDQNGLDVILNQCELLQSKVTKLLQYNRLEYLSKDEEFKDVKMRGIIENVILTYKHQSNINIDIELDDSTFKGYEENYYTVIDNILDNQFRYAKSKVSIKLENGELFIFNDGEPIEEKFLNGLFKAYEKGSKGQFGLGMSIVKKTLDFFGYEINVANQEDGVLFHIAKGNAPSINTL